MHQNVFDGRAPAARTRWRGGGGYSAFQDPLAGLGRREVRKRKGREGRGGGKREGKKEREDPQCLKCVDANVNDRCLLLLDCEEAYDHGILQHVDGFQYPTIKPRSSDAPFKACCYVHNDTSKLLNP